jgi:hypothetical protein
VLSDAAVINHRIKIVLVTGWALWITVIFTTNVLDALQELKVLPRGWKASSGNFDYIDAVTARYSVPDWMDAILFGGAIAWEGAIVVLLWRAVADLSRSRAVVPVSVSAAFLVSLPLWLAFAVMDELFINFQPEATHLRIFIAQSVTLLIVWLLPPVTQSQPGNAEAQSGAVDAED